MKMLFTTFLFMALSPTLAQAKNATLQEALYAVEGQVTESRPYSQLYIGKSDGVMEIMIDGEFYPISTVAMGKREVAPKAICDAFDMPLLDFSIDMNKRGDKAAVLNEEGRFVRFEKATDVYTRISCGKSH